jgi:hypothetical protein
LLFGFFSAGTVLAAITATLVSPASAATTMSGDEVVVSAHEVIEDDLVVWGTYVRIDGIVRGDVVALGTDIVVEGLIEGDLMAAAKTVYLNGAVHDDARVAAYAVAFGERASIGDDGFVLAYSLEAKPASRIGGTAWVAARQARLAGQIAETLAVRAGALALFGLTAGDAHAVVGGLEGFVHSSLMIDLAIEIPDVPDGLTVAKDAYIGGDLDYSAQHAATIEPGATVVGETRRTPWEAESSTLPAAEEPVAPEAPFPRAFDRFVLLALLGLLLLAAAPRFLHARGDELAARPLKSLGWGIGAFVVTGVASFALGTVGLASVVGLAGGSGAVAFGLAAATFFMQVGLLAVFLVALFYAAPALVCLALGTELFARLGRAPVDDSRSAGIAPLLVGCALYAALRAVPFLGVLAAILAALAGLGALALWAESVRRAGAE